MKRDQKRRSYIDISAAILHIARNGARKTRIVYSANINFKLFTQYLERLEVVGLIEDDGNNQFKTTEKGKDYLKHYREFKELGLAPTISLSL